MTNAIPSHFDHYEVAGLLGSGQYGNVFLARDKKLWRWVMLKVLHPHVSANKQLVQYFIKEARLVAGMRHPNLVTVLSIQDSTAQPYIVTEFVEGVSLDTYLRQRTISVNEALPILRQLALALDAIHQQKMIHQDVRPNNVLIGPAGHIQLTNFGLIKLTQTATVTQLSNQQLIDKMLYLSPEQAAKQEKIGPASDVYALGVIAYEMFAGRTPFVGSNRDLILAAHIKSQPPDPRSFNRQVPAGVAMALQKVLSKKPSQRFRNAHAFVQALERSLITQHAQTGTYVVADPSTTPPLLLPPAMPMPSSVSQPTLTPPSQPTSEPLRQGRLSCLLLIGLATLLLVGIAVQDVLPNLQAWIGGEASQEESATQTSVAKDGMIQLYVPEGEFLMGSSDENLDAIENEFPQHRVFLDAYWIDQTEITNAMYSKCVEAAACSPPVSNKSQTRESYYNNPEYDNYPVIWVSWEDATAYCAWAGRRLPTEAEWEKAARGTEGNRYPWGNERPLGTRANYCDQNCSFNWKDQAVDDQHEDTAPVDSYKEGQSPYGTRNMAGNVWEWVADWYDEAYYTNSPERNPTGPQIPSARGKRVVRGGSWNNEAKMLSAAVRSFDFPTTNGNNWGFRCARSDEP